MNGIYEADDARRELIAQQKQRIARLTEEVANLRAELRVARRNAATQAATGPTT